MEVKDGIRTRKDREEVGGIKRKKRKRKHRGQGKFGRTREVLDRDDKSDKSSR